jgi:hypothetical protein
MVPEPNTLTLVPEELIIFFYWILRLKECGQLWTKRVDRIAMLSPDFGSGIMSQLVRQITPPTIFKQKYTLLSRETSKVQE